VNPVAGSFSPLVAMMLLHNDTLQLSVTDGDADLVRVVLLAEFASSYEVVHDGNAFGPTYSGSSRTAVTGGFDFSIVKASPGWKEDLTLHVIAVDAAGNQIATEAYAWPVLPLASNPAITNIAPSPGSSVASNGPVQFDLTDVDSGGVFQSVVVFADFGSVYEVVYDGTNFGPSYAAGSSKSSIANGFHFAITRNYLPGWLGNFTLRMYVIDADGNQLSPIAYSWLSSPIAANPVVGNFSPPSGAAITAGSMLQFDVTDANSGGAFARVIVHFQFPSLGEWEVAHDGDSFAPMYAGGGSTREAIANGYRFKVKRSGGWPAPPVVKVFAVDAEGDEA
jgi:hypothetical protein